MIHLHIYDIKSGNVTEKEIEITSIVPDATIIKTASSIIVNSQVTEKDDVHPARGTSIYIHFLYQYISFLFTHIFNQTQENNHFLFHHRHYPENKAEKPCR